MTKKSKQRHLNIVVPVFNECETLGEFYSRTRRVINNLKLPNWRVSLIFVDDGSTDSTNKQLTEILKNGGEFNISVVTLSRNFGHQQAVWAGIENSNPKSCVLVMDADLQDPPEMIEEFLFQLEVNDVVVARRRSRKDSSVKKLFAHLFYLIIGKLTAGAVKANVGDFWAISERAKVALLDYGEELKFLRGLISQLGFEVKEIEYDRDSRYAGQTHYTIFKMIQLAIAGVTGFTIQPLIYVVYVAVFMSSLLLPSAMFLAWSRLFGDSIISPGLTFVGIVIIVSISLQFIVLAALALYIARIAIEIKHRPVYILESINSHKAGVLG